MKKKKVSHLPKHLPRRLDINTVRRMMDVVIDKIRDDLNEHIYAVTAKAQKSIENSNSALVQMQKTVGRIDALEKSVDAILVKFRLQWPVHPCPKCDCKITTG